MCSPKMHFQEMFAKYFNSFQVGLQCRCWRATGSSFHHSEEFIIWWKKSISVIIFNTADIWSFIITTRCCEWSTSLGKNSNSSHLHSLHRESILRGAQHLIDHHLNAQSNQIFPKHDFEKRITGTMFCFLFLPPPAEPLLGVVAVSFMNPPPDWLEFHIIWRKNFLQDLAFYF